MQSTKKPALRHMVLPDATFSANSPKAGLLLMDLSLKPIAYDRGAAAILKSQSYPTVQPEPPFFPPREVLEMVGDLKPNEQPSKKMTFRLGKSDYSCTSYLMESQEGVPARTMVALHIEKIVSVTDAVSAVATKYNLTEREGQALSGLSMGLCSKKLAEKMNISPNTVKVFLRLIMIKMGVSSRGGIVAELIHNQNNLPFNEMDAATGART